MELKQYQAGLCKILSRQLEKQLSLPELEGKNLIDTYGINSLIALEIIIDKRLHPPWRHWPVGVTSTPCKCLCKYDAVGMVST